MLRLKLNNILIMKSNLVNRPGGFDKNKLKPINVKNVLGIPRMESTNIIDKQRVKSFVRILPEERDVPRVGEYEMTQERLYGQKLNIQPNRLLQLISTVTSNIPVHTDAGVLQIDPNTGQPKIKNVNLINLIKQPNSIQKLLDLLLFLLGLNNKKPKTVKILAGILAAIQTIEDILEFTNISFNRKNQRIWERAREVGGKFLDATTLEIQEAIQALSWDFQGFQKDPSVDIKHGERVDEFVKRQELKQEDIMREHKEEREFKQRPEFMAPEFRQRSLTPLTPIPLGQDPLSPSISRLQTPSLIRRRRAWVGTPTPTPTSLLDPGRRRRRRTPTPTPSVRSLRSLSRRQRTPLVSPSVIEREQRLQRTPSISQTPSLLRRRRAWVRRSPSERTPTERLRATSLGPSPSRRIFSPLDVSDISSPPSWLSGGPETKSEEDLREIWEEDLRKAKGIQVSFQDIVHQERASIGATIVDDFGGKTTIVGSILTELLEHGLVSADNLFLLMDIFELGNDLSWTQISSLPIIQTPKGIMAVIRVFYKFGEDGKNKSWKTFYTTANRKYAFASVRGYPLKGFEQDGWEIEYIAQNNIIINKDPIRFI